MKNDPKQIDSDTRDPELTRLFAERNESLPDRDFMLGMIDRLERIHKRGLQRKMLALAAGIGAAAYAFREFSLADFLTAATADAWSSEIFSALDPSGVASTLNSPITWAVLCAIVATTLPVVYVWKVWR